MNLNPQGTNGPELSCYAPAIVRVRRRGARVYVTRRKASLSCCFASMPAAAAGSEACPSPSRRRALSRFPPGAHPAIRSVAPQAYLRLPALGPEPFGMDETSGSRLIRQAGDSLSAGGLRVAAKNPAPRWTKADMISSGLVRGEGVLIRREADEQRSIRNHTLSLQRLVRHRSTNPQSKMTPPTPAGSARWATTSTPLVGSAPLRADLLRADPAGAAACLTRELRLPPGRCRHLSPLSLPVSGTKCNGGTDHQGTSWLPKPAAEQDDVRLGSGAMVVWKVRGRLRRAVGSVERWRYLHSTDAS